MSVIFSENSKIAIRKLADSGLFVLEEGVPIFGVHTRDFPNGKKVEVTDSDLEEICKNTTELFGGYLPCVTIGHRDHSLSARETEQPPVVGFMVGLDCKDGVIYADLFIYKNRFRDYLGYPYRSAEYVDSAKTIIGLAVLKRPPFLGVGTKIESIEYKPGDKVSLAPRSRGSDLLFKRVF